MRIMGASNAAGTMLLSYLLFRAGLYAAN